MSDFEFIPPGGAPMVVFSAEPAYNTSTSLMLLNWDLSGVSPWVGQTAASLPPEVLATNQLVAEPATAYLDGNPWPSFPAWVDDIAARDPYEMRDQTLASWLSKVESLLGAGAGDLPTPEQLLADRDAYLSLTERALDCKGKPCDPALYEEEHALLQDPVARQELIVSHLRQMWDEVMAQEWERNQPVIGEAIAAFESMDYSGKAPAEILREVSGRDRVPREWRSWLPDVEQLIFIPSAHIGPYLLLIYHDESTARIVFGAHTPKGATVVSPALNRSELLMRLSALADDTRLSILELLAERGELCAQEIIASLGISQSAASRHLRQLGATGYVLERRREGAKCYRLNPERFDDTLGNLKALLRGSPAGAG